MRSLPKKTWKYAKQHRLKLAEREYNITFRRTDFPLFYNPLNISRLIVSNWIQLKRLCYAGPQRVLFAWVADNESKVYRRVLDLAYRLTLRKTWIIGVFKPTRWYVKRHFDIRVYPTILWLGWDKTWIELGRFEGMNFNVSDLLDIEEDIKWRPEPVNYGLEAEEEIIKEDRWEKRLKYLSYLNLKGRTLS